MCSTRVITADRLPAPNDKVAFPVPRHRPVGGFGQSLGDQDLVRDRFPPRWSSPARAVPPGRRLPFRRTPGCPRAWQYRARQWIASAHTCQFDRSGCSRPWSPADPGVATSPVPTHRTPHGPVAGWPPPGAVWVGSVVARARCRGRPGPADLTASAPGDLLVDHRAITAQQPPDRPARQPGREAPRDLLTLTSTQRHTTHPNHPLTKDHTPYPGEALTHLHQGGYR